MRELERARREPWRPAATGPLPRADAAHGRPSRAGRACTGAATSCSCPPERRARCRRSSAGTAAPRAAEIAPRLDRACERAGSSYSKLVDPRPADALGELLALGRDELQLATAARAGAGARLRRLARGLPPRGHGPLAAVLGAAGPPLAGIPRARAVAAHATARRSCSSCHVPGHAPGAVAGTRAERVGAPTAPRWRARGAAHRSRLVATLLDDLPAHPADIGLDRPVAADVDAAAGRSGTDALDRRPRSVRQPAGSARTGGP